MLLPCTNNLDSDQDQDSSLEDEKAKKEDRPSSSTHSRTIQTKKDLAMTSPNREKYAMTASGNFVRTPSIGSIEPEHKTEDYSSDKTRSHATTVYSSVPADCIYKVISQSVKRSSFERLSTLRPAPKIVLKSICCRSCSHSSSSKTHRRVLLRAPGNWCKKRRQGTPTCNPKLISVRTLMRSIESVVEKEELQF